MVVEADTGATQPSFRLAPLFDEGGGLYCKPVNKFSKFKPIFDFKERRA